MLIRLLQEVRIMSWVWIWRGMIIAVLRMRTVPLRMARSMVCLCIVVGEQCQALGTHSYLMACDASIVMIDAVLDAKKNDVCEDEDENKDLHCGTLNNPTHSLLGRILIFILLFVIHP
jgi:hypothetical protein